MEENKDLKKIVIGVPHTGVFNAHTVMSLLSLAVPDGYQMQFHFVASCLLYESRERIARYALQENADYLLFLDSDMVVPYDLVVKLVKHDLMFVTGMAFKRIYPYQPCFYTTVRLKKDFKPILESPAEFPDEGLLKIEGAGMACCLIKTDVFRNVKPPWFFPLPNIGEDLTFCLKLQKNKIDMFVDLGINVGHVGDTIVQKEYFKETYDIHVKSGKKGLLFGDASSDCAFFSDVKDKGGAELEL